MKKFSDFFESYASTNMSDNPGNDLISTGVANHYTPVENILTNIRNLFCVKRGILAQKAADDVSIVLSSEFFTSVDKINNLMNCTINDVDHTSLKDYIFAQGLTKMSIVRRSPIGQYDVYFSAPDLKTANVPADNTTCCGDDCKSCDCKCKDNCNCEDPYAVNLPKVRYYEMYNDEDEIAYSTLINESGDDDDDELEALTQNDVIDIVSEKNKKKAAKKLSELVAQEMTLPENIYFAAVKSKSGRESIALRWKYKTARPFDEKIEITRSIMNIYGVGKNAIWIDVWKTKPIKLRLPDEINDLLENLLELLGAKETQDRCCWRIPEPDTDNKQDDEDEKKDTEDTKDTNDDVSDDSKLTVDDSQNINNQEDLDRSYDQKY